MWSFIEKLIPEPYKAYAKLIKWGLILIIIASWSGFCYYKGNRYNEAEWQAKIAKAEKDSFKKGIESVKVTEKIVTVYKDRVITIEKEVTKYVKQVDKAVPDQYNIDLPNGLVWLLDDAVQDGFSEGSSKPDEPSGQTKADESSGIDLREASKVVLENYAICYANAAQLESLQKWVKEQEAIYTNKQKRKWFFFKAD